MVSSSVRSFLSVEVCTLKYFRVTENPIGK